jgi:hypothetical protein
MPSFNEPDVRSWGFIWRLFLFIMNLMRMTCYYLLAKWLDELDHPKKDDPNFLIRAENWNHRNSDCGHCNLTGYLLYLNNKRLENRNIDLWHELRRQVFIRDNYTCTYCKSVGGVLECDHVIPFSKGGSNELDILTTSCRRCKTQKKDKSVDEFLHWKQNRI